MRWGLTLLIRLTNSAADFSNAYCSADCFPLAVFDRAKLPSGRDAAADDVFKSVLRGADVATEGGRLHVPASFRVCVSSFFSAEGYERFLKDSLPLAHMQPMHVVDPSAKTRVADLPPDEKPLLKGQTNEGQLTGDRTSLVLQGWGLKAGPDENPAGRPTGIGGAKTDGSFNIIPA